MFHLNCVMFMVSVFAVLAIQYESVSADDNCQLNRYEQSVNSTVMQFTKEAASHEFAVMNAFKSMHCCAKGYRSIEWYVQDLYRNRIVE